MNKLKTFLSNHLTKKRMLWGMTALGSALAVLPMLSAFEAHVINVTAQIENALSVTTDAIDFGTVFPQEHLHKPLSVILSKSFLAEGRVDDVEYFIRQKPKCAITSKNGQAFDAANTATGHIKFGDNPATATTTETYYIDCGPAPRQLTEGETWGVLPSLCEYISKEPDGRPANDGTTLSFHIPWTISTSTGSTTIIWNDTHGRLAKSEQDTVDNWTIDLAVPCFGGMCAQDWADFVHQVSGSTSTDPKLYEQPAANQHKIFGCDLWVEVSGVSEATSTQPTASTTLTVTKVVINDNGGNNVVGDFALTVDGNPVTSGATTSVTAGSHLVSETGVSGYQATFSGDCDSSGNVTVNSGGHKFCILTNNDIAPTITLIKQVVGGTATSGQFTLRVDGTTVPNNASIVVTANASHFINEDSKPGYVLTSITGAGCPAATATPVMLNEGQSITCTLTNTAP